MNTKSIIEAQKEIVLSYCRGLALIDWSKIEKAKKREYFRGLISASKTLEYLLFDEEEEELSNSEKKLLKKVTNLPF
jgi:RNA polymerase-interacting CarD/CdnL/TRCF family regulator